MSIKRELRKLFWKAGYDVSRFSPGSHPVARRGALLRLYRIDTVLDVGANSGQYARQLRGELGYAGRILSFEPLSSAFELLEASARRDPKWEVFNLALDDTDQRQEINVAGNSYSSSLLDMLPAHLKSAPTSGYVGTEAVEVRRLDSCFSDLCGSSDRIYLKIDTQGFESRVLKGAEESLSRIDTVQMEMSLVPLYDGEILLPDMCLLMRERGYDLVALEPGFSDATHGQLLQADGVFHRP